MESKLEVLCHSCCSAGSGLLPIRFDSYAGEYPSPKASG